MAQLPTYDEWMKGTYSTLHKRSEFLKKLDETIKSGASNKIIKEALDRWKFDQSRQGKDWKKSVRNRKGAVTNLYRVVNELDKRQLSDEEREALEFISRAQTMALSKQFEGKKLSFKSTTLVGLVQGAGSNFQKFKTGATAFKQGAKTGHGAYKNITSIHDGAKLLQQGGRAAAHGAASLDLQKKIMKLCKTLTPGLDADKVFANLNLGSVSQFAGSVAPFVGAISSGGKAVVAWIGVAKTVYTKHDIAERRFAFAPEDPEAAFDAVLLLLKRDVISKSAKAGVATGAFTGKLLGAFADAGAVTGPAIGLLETLANIFQTIVEYVRDYKEVEKANELLRVGYLNLDLFNVSPILGCYFLLIQDHSTIINFAVADYGTPNFVFDAERLIGKINPVLDQARSYVHSSRYEIVGFEAMKGIVQKNWSRKGVVGKVTGLPAHVAGKITGKITDWVLNPEKPPKVDKSRLVGISSRDHIV